MKRERRSTKGLTVKKRMIGFFAIALIVLGVIGGFGINRVIAESTGSAGSSDTAAVVADTSIAGGGGSNANVLVSDDNTGTSTNGNSGKTTNTDYVPSVNVNNLASSSYPQTGDADESGLVILGSSILIGLFAFYMKKLRKELLN